MLSRVFVSRASRILQSSCRLVVRPGSRWWSVFSGLSATSRAASQRHWINSVCACSKVCACNAHKLTQGDSDLLSFLKDEIKFEKDTSPAVPNPELFKATTDGTLIKLERDDNGERIAITFDVNQNVNEDQAYLSEDESDDEKPASADDTQDVAGNIVSYPSFTVDITKASGHTLRFTCEFNQGVIPTPEGEKNGKGEVEEIFQVVNVCVMESADAAHHKTIYAAETENIDPNLYTMLLNMLAERGVDDGFGHWLLDYSTAMEHKHYIKFLQDLQGFVKEG